jgi:hypothetical protein
VVTVADNVVTKVAAASIRGDSLQHKVVFENGRTLRDMASGGAVQLRFTVGEGGALYSFTID